MSRRQPALPRGRRSVLATVVALLVLALAVLGAVAAVQIHAGDDRTALGSVSWVAERLRTRDWTDVGVLVAGVACAAIGLVLLLAGLFPARRPLLRLADPDEHTISGITRPGLVRDLAAVAEAVDGVSGARVRLRRRRVMVRARSPLRDATGIRDAVEAAVGERLTALALVRSLAVRARVDATGGS